MGIKVNVKWKFNVNGKTYGSAEEMPGPIREAYEKAVAKVPNPERGTNASISSTSIVFNGQEYANAESMPAEIRQKFQSIMKAVDVGMISPGKDAGIGFDTTAAGLKSEELPIPPGVPRPIAPESAISSRQFFIGAALVALLLGLYLLLHTGGIR